MRKYVFISIGSFLGAIFRYLIKLIPISGYHEHVPLNTLMINITGAFILALIMTVYLEVWHFDADVRLGITTGFLGAFTTFSALCKETVGLLQSEIIFPPLPT
jgi:CrcB protein